jgi:hypothetical protein
MLIALHVNIHYSCQILMNLEYSLQIFERYQVPKFMETHSLGTELFHADGRKRRTDRRDQACFNYQLDAQFLYSVIYVLH